MSKSRRELLTRAAAGIVGVAAAPAASATVPEPQATPAPGTPPAFGTAPALGPEVSAMTFAEAEKLMRVELTPAERAQAAGNWRQSMAALTERRTGPRKVPLPDGLAPAKQWNPVLPGLSGGRRATGS